MKKFNQKFRKTSAKGILIAKNSQFYLMVFGIGLIVLAIALTVSFFKTIGYLSLVGSWMPAVMGIFICLLSLMRSTIQIDTNKREVTIVRKNWKNKQTSNTFPMDDIRITATRMGATADPAGTGVSTRETWIAKAGFMYENFDRSIYSQQTSSMKECVTVMLELYSFFFPDRKNITEQNVITNGNAAAVMTEQEIKEMEAQRDVQERGTADGDEAVFEVGS